MDNDSRQAAFVPVKNGLFGREFFLIVVSDVDRNLNFCIIQDDCQMIFTHIQILQDFGRDIDFACQDKEFPYFIVGKQFPVFIKGDGL